MHIGHFEDLCKVVTETEKITFLSGIAAVSAEKINTTAIIMTELFTIVNSRFRKTTSFDMYK